MDPYFIGVDVGSGSVRAGLFTATGDLLQVSVKEIKINNPEPGYYEQSSENIWSAVCQTVQDVTKSADKDRIGGISFCATCSLVAIGQHAEPVSVNKNGDSEWNIVMWMDHRAEKEAELINATKHGVLKYVGGSISLEMETPKLLWLKTHLKESYNSTKHYFDLGDYLRWKATGSLKRSICCIVCKWTFVNGPSKCSWDESYFKQVGIEDALKKIGNLTSFPGDSNLISAEAAKCLGLNTNIQVGFSMIDAHSGVLGMIGCHSGGDAKKTAPVHRLGLISGTSTCHMALNEKPRDIPGIWGPYYGVIFNNLHLSEGGQSAAGKLLDHVVMNHPAYSGMLAEIKSHGAVLGKLEEKLLKLAEKGTNISALTNNLHIWPDFHGNRSPIADPTLKGMISGLSLSTSEDDLAILYLATIQALAYGSRHIQEEMEKAGHKFTELVICGGLTKSKLFLQTHSDVLGLPVVIPNCKEPVLLGAAISAAAAFHAADADDSNEDNCSLENIVEKMAGGCSRIEPTRANKAYHDKKYSVFLKMLDDQRKYKIMMQ